MSEDIDAIVAEAEASTNQDVPMAAPEASSTPEPSSPQEFEFQAHGQTVKVPYGDERLKRWAEMGYGANQKLQQYNQELQARDARIREYESKFKDYESKYKPYQEIDTWAKQNPQAWQSLEASWKAQLQGMTPSQVAQLPPEIKQQLDETKQFIEQQKVEKQIQRDRTADAILDNEIQSLRKQYSNIDFGNPRDPNSLEMQVLRHGITNGLPSFRAAFMDFFGPQLIKMAQEKGREFAGKSLQRTKGLGLPGSSAPRGRNSAPDLKNLTYDQIHQLALQEIGAD